MPRQSNRQVARTGSNIGNLHPGLEIQHRQYLVRLLPCIAFRVVERLAARRIESPLHMVLVLVSGRRWCGRGGSRRLSQAVATSQQTDGE
jgi:hypothetical protein